ncbi:RICIN domain-containing protein [Nonomuraea aurantiaca]|uniref:RICIN domain-containing protein n=1 Tax=Nonomuraea aurantiaca TaxID=2878562 RepID=UPI001CD9C753|nr:RICIN domain-containing protein [Nonomuraea aurantiaca]MCA2220768.1 RICIN domain-containing protein [Nonomuraea aurantiaca]
MRHQTGFQRRVLTVLVMFAMALGFPAAAQASSLSSTALRSNAAGTAKCVGLANNGSTANGTPLVIWDCHLRPDQQWGLPDSPAAFGFAS